MRSYFDLTGISITDRQLSQFETFFDLLISENEKYNLTGITDKQDVYVKHFIDSILINKLNFDFSNKKMMDIGTGAGFPAIPLKIMEPTLSVTGLDALNKRLHFIELVCDSLGLSQMSLLHGRAEDFGHDLKHREQYDFVVSRAVAELRLLLEFTMPFVKVNGYFLAYKSLKSQTELEDAQKALSVLKAKLIDIVEFKLPLDYGTREIMIFQKTEQLDKKYPRKPGIPKKSPL